MVVAKILIGECEVGGAIMTPEPSSLLPFVFVNSLEAQWFLDSAERSGVNLYRGMPLNEMAQLVRLWRDGNRPVSPDTAPAELEVNL